MSKEGIINVLTRKLCENVPLTHNEINTIISALRESKHCFKEPYYEVIYHDKYGNTESRIMDPVDSKTFTLPNGELICDEFFELRFRRLINKED